jgi:hypothetical protein
VAGLFFMKKQCLVIGCGEEHEALGFCRKHYMRFRKGASLTGPDRFGRTLEERYREKLGPKDPVTGCIEWTARRNNDGYGQLRVGSKTIGAHRLAYELKHGPIPPGMKVCHHCDNPACCNDEHLFLGTDADNMADREAKGRGVRLQGEKHGRAKLTEAAVVEIRRRLAAGEVQRVIAEDFGISNQEVSNIKTGISWKHLK